MFVYFLAIGYRFLLNLSSVELTVKYDFFMQKSAGSYLSKKYYW